MDGTAAIPPASSTATLSAPLLDFVHELDTLMERDWPLPRLFDVLVPEFARLLREPDLLSTAQQQPGPTRYAQHNLYGCPRNRYALVALVWRPGERTPIHDHRAWGLAGVYRGCERETRFAPCDGVRGGLGLRRAELTTVHAGEVLPIVPPTDIHQVENFAAAGPTVSLHLYGTNVLLTPDGSSVKRQYSAELVVGESALDRLPQRS